MKLVFALVALASVAAVNAAPGIFFEKTAPLEDLEKIQISNRKIALAGDDMDITEAKLQTLAGKSADIEGAAQVLMDAATVEAYKETDVEFKHKNV